MKPLVAWLLVALSIAAIPYVMAQTSVGEKIAVFDVQIAAQQKAVDTIPAMAQDVATTKAQMGMVLWLMAGAGGMLTAIAVFLWRIERKQEAARRALDEDAKKLRATGHEIAQFMGAVELIPELAKKADRLEQTISRLPCMRHPERACEGAD